MTHALTPRRLGFMEMLPFAEFQSRLSEFLDVAKRQREQFTIIKNDEPTAVVLSYDEWESMVETMAVLSNPELVADLKEAEDSQARGETYSLEEVMAEFEERRAR